MISKEHYFDWAATSPADSEILKKALELSLEHWANPSSIHAAGVDAKTSLEEARAKCAKILGVKSETLFFTSGGTESDHIPLLSVLTRPQKGSIILSSIEHPALREMSKMLTNLGWKVIFVNPDKNGFVSSQSILDAIQDDTVFVSVMAVNNETGAIQNIYEIADKLLEVSSGRRKIFFHIDCVQAAGKIPLDLNHKGIDSAAFSAHKICGPRGIGLLYLNKEINGFLKGGGQEKNVRSGTENLFGAQAMALCLEKYFISKNQNMERFEEQRKITSDFIQKILTIKGASIIPHCRSDKAFEDKFSPWIVQASFKGIPGQVMERALSSKGFFISTGSACSASKHSRPVLDSMGIGAEEKEDAVRFSFGFESTENSINELYEAVKSVAELFAK